MEGPLQCLLDCPHQTKTLAPWMILDSYWPTRKKCSPLKLFCKMEQYFTEIILARSFTKFDHLVPVGQKYCCHGQFWIPNG